MTANDPTTFPLGHRKGASVYAPEPDVIGAVEFSGAGHTVLRIGKMIQGHGGWHQTGHVVLSSEERDLLVSAVTEPGGELRRLPVGALVQSERMHGLFGTVTGTREHRGRGEEGLVEYEVRNGPVTSWIAESQVRPATLDDIVGHYSGLLREAQERANQEAERAEHGERLAQVRDALEALKISATLEYPGALAIRVTARVQVWTGHTGWDFGTVNVLDDDNTWQPVEGDAATLYGIDEDEATPEEIAEAWATWVDAYRMGAR